MGSSPLARGLPAAVPPGLGTPGIIPARAGFTWRRRSPRPRTGDHPRSRGVYPGEALRPGLRPGSSPLARGLRGPTEPAGYADRIIPARAGFTAPTASVSGARSDHPRSRGVYLRRRLQPLRRIRIIPARAGFTLTTDRKAPLPPDHPRSRGVYPQNQATSWVTCGSSPLARGLLGVRLRGGCASRIIPARAGFTGSPTCRGGRCRDHPRSRGVYTMSAPSTDMPPGSSPLARGLQLRELLHELRVGIIPARAGFTT